MTDQEPKPADVPVPEATSDPGTAPVAAETPAVPTKPTAEKPAEPVADPVADPVAESAEAPATEAPATEAAAETPSPAVPSEDPEPPQLTSLKPTPDELFPTRVRVIRNLIRESLLTDGATARETIEGRVSTDELVVILLVPIQAIRALPAPQPGDLAAWGQLASLVTDVWRQFFAHDKPADQRVNDMLHSLQQSVAIPPILGKLAMQAAGLDALDSTWLDTHIDGSQTREFEAVNVKPYDVLPLIESIARTRSAMAVRAAV